MLLRYTQEVFSRYAEKVARNRQIGKVTWMNKPHLMHKSARKVIYTSVVPKGRNT